MNKILKLIFYISLFLLVLISIWPGSLIGYFFYGDWGEQPNIVENPFGTAINHFFCYIYVSLLGFYLYSKTENFNSIIYLMFFLSSILELAHNIIPNRSFEIIDLFGNILGVLVAYLIIKIYLLFYRYE